MDPLLIVIIGGVFTILGSVVTIWWQSRVNRKQDTVDMAQKSADTKQTQVETQRTETVYYQELTDELVQQVKDLKKLWVDSEKQHKADTDLARAVHEERQKYSDLSIADLHKKVDDLKDTLNKADGKSDALTAALENANDKLDDANKTIKELQKTITDLRANVSQLLIELAQQKTVAD